MWIPCRCGRIFRDESHAGRVAGVWLADEAFDQLVDAVAEIASGVAEAYAAGGTGAVARRMFRPDYPGDLSLGQMAHDAVSDAVIDATRPVFECPRCGTLQFFTATAPPVARAYEPVGEHRGVFGLTAEDMERERARLASEEE